MKPGDLVRLNSNYGIGVLVRFEKKHARTASDMWWILIAKTGTIRPFGPWMINEVIS
jgi:hypothetical protein